MMTTEWTCSCGSVNGLGKSKCACCGRSIPRAVCKRVYKEELDFQRERFNCEVLEKHNRFWYENARKFMVARKICGVLCVLLVAAFVCSFYGHRHVLRMDYVETRYAEVRSSAISRVEGMDWEKFSNEELNGNPRRLCEHIKERFPIDTNLQRLKEDVRITLVERFDTVGKEELNNDLQKLYEHIKERFQQISEAKERILDYVN